MTNLLLQQQRRFDQLNFDMPDWQLKELKDRKTRHIHLHLAKAAGALIGAIDKPMTTIVGDLSIYRSQLMHTHEIDPVTITAEQLLGENTSLEPIGHLVVASARLAEYLEPREHGPVESDGGMLITRAAWNIHNAVTVLGIDHDISPADAHLSRMHDLLGERSHLLIPQV